VLPLRILAGALIGGAVGVLMGRARVCGAEKCNVRANMIASIVAGAAFGAAVAAYLSAR
jgi:hypothetical protein